MGASILYKVWDQSINNRTKTSSSVYQARLQNENKKKTPKKSIFSITKKQKKRKKKRERAKKRACICEFVNLCVHLHLSTCVHLCGKVRV